MRKRILSIVMTICMVLALLPMATIPASAATITVTDEASLNSAVSAAVDGDVVQLANDISLTTDPGNGPSIVITNNHSFTLDLNGHKLIKTGAYGAIWHQGSGELTIDDTSAGGTGEISSNANMRTTIAMGAGTLTVNAGTITNTTGFNAIADGYGPVGTINIKGGLLRGGIESAYGGTFNIYGGSTIQATRYGIRGNTTSNLVSTINIYGGRISATNYYGVEADNCATIHVYGAAVMQGGNWAMNKVPESISAGLVVKASTNYDGSNPVSEYNPANINSYKYVEYVSPPPTYDATISVNKNGSAWTDVANDKIVLSTSEADATTGQLTAAPAGGMFSFSNISATTVYVWAKNNAGTYVKTGSVSSSNNNPTVNYYDVTLTKGTGIESVAGDGTYLSGETASVSATLSDGYTWDKWSDNNTTLNRSITVSTKAALTANAALTAATAPTVTVTGAALSYGYSSGSVSVSATAPDGQTITGYQWYSNLTNSNTGGTAIADATSASYALATGKSVGTTEYYYCVVTSTRTDNSQTATATSDVATVTVGKADGSGSVNLDDWTYGGTAKVPVPASATNGTDHVSYSYEGTGSTSYPATTAVPTNAGTYKVTATFAAADSYQECSATDNFTIAKMSLTPVIGNVDGKQYDGTTAATGVISLTGVNGESPVATGTFVWTAAGAGTATVNATDIALTSDDVNKNYVISTNSLTNVTPANGTKILPKALDLSAQTVVYNGTTSITVADYATGVSSEKMNLTYTTAAKATGTYTYSATPGEGKFTLALSDPNYTVNTAGNLTVSTKALTIPAETVTYNGGTSFTQNITGANGEAVTITYTPYSKNAGSYSYASAPVEGKYTATLSDSVNYSIASGETLTVDPLAVVLTWDYSAPFTYDDTAKTVAATVSNKLGEDPLNLTYSNNSKTNAGSYTAEVTSLGNSNYTITGAANASKEWVIDKAPISFVVTDNSYHYDAVAHKATVVQTESQTPVIAIDKFAVTYKLSADSSAAADKTSAGVYDVIVTLSDDNFCFAGESDPAARSHKIGQLTISQNTVTALWKNMTTVYDGTAKAPILELVGLKTEDTDVKAQLKETKTDAGTYPVTAELTGTNSGNYTLTNSTGTFIIQRAPVSFTLTGNSVKKGESVNVIATPSVSGIAATLTYWQNGKQVAVPVETGSYDVYAEITNTNYRHMGGTDGTAQKIGVLTIYESSTPATYTVGFDANGGTGSTASMNTVQAGMIRILPESGFTNTGKTFAGWQYGSRIYQPGERFAQPASNVTLKALWNNSVYSIGGTVQEKDPAVKAANVVVTLMLGSRQIGQTVTGADGTYSFVDLVPGVYNLVANKDGVIQTILVTIEDKAVTDQTITMPAGNLNSVVEVKAGSPAIVVGDLEKALRIKRRRQVRLWN